MKYSTIKKVINIFILCAAMLIVCPLFALIFTKTCSTNLIPFYIVLALTAVMTIPVLIHLGLMIHAYRKAVKVQPKYEGTVCDRVFQLMGKNNLYRLKIKCGEQTYLTPKVYGLRWEFYSDKKIKFILIKNRAYITDIEE